jgi:hypothetical protein
MVISSLWLVIGEENDEKVFSVHMPSIHPAGWVWFPIANIDIVFSFPLVTT